MMFEINYSKAMHIFTDASGFAAGLLLGQYKVNMFLPIPHNSFIFNPTERRYRIYKGKLLSYVQFAQKYDYIVSNSYIPSIIHTDYKPLTHFQNSNIYNSIYAQ